MLLERAAAALVTSATTAWKNEAFCSSYQGSMIVRACSCGAPAAPADHLGRHRLKGGPAFMLLSMKSDK